MESPREFLTDSQMDYICTDLGQHGNDSAFSQMWQAGTFYIIILNICEIKPFARQYKL
jgi:hypothetical protein